jgi:cytochrome c-type biogenesis protein CcmH
MKYILVILLWLPVAVFAQGAQPTPQDPVANKRAVQLAEELRCLVCQNQSIAESNAELAVDLRRQIREQIALGKSDAEINAYMVDRYGDFVLYRPQVKMVTLLLWFGPLLLLMIGFFVLFRYVRERGRKSASQQPLTVEQQHEAESLLGSGESVKK